MVEARWLRAGTGASAKPGLGPQWIHVDRNRPVGVRLLQGDANEAVVALLQSLLRNWRTQDIAQQRHQVRISGVRDERGAPFDDHASTFVTGAFSYIDLQLIAD